MLSRPPAPPATVSYPPHIPLNNFVYPRIAWPTILLLFACLITIFATHFFALTDENIVDPRYKFSTRFFFDISLHLKDDVFSNQKYWFLFFIRVIAMYVVFTPLHDAVHRAVSPAIPILNDVVGHLAGLGLSAPFLMFSHVHLAHHKQVY
jgi:hypothetical protein